MIDAYDAITRIITVAELTGYFDDVSGYEPPSAPGRGIRAGLWVADYRAALSGLDSVSIRLELTMRITRDAGGDELDAIDPDILAATSAMYEALCGDFELGGTARKVDIFGAEGEPLRARSGWVTIDTLRYRAMNLTIPIIYNDVHDEEA